MPLCSKECFKEYHQGKHSPYYSSLEYIKKVPDYKPGMVEAGTYRAMALPTRRSKK